MYNSDTIYANFTPIVKAPVIGYRISGPLTEKILLSLTRFNFNKSPNVFIYRALFDSKDNIIDKANIVFFKSPRSYTGEDVAEIFIHGSPTLASQLEKTISQINPFSIRVATKGEFTYRALINNKISLKQGEAVNRIIMSDNIKEINYSKKILFNGDSESALYGLKEKIINIYSMILTTIDFGDDESFDIRLIKKKIINFFKEIREIIEKNRTIIEQKNNCNLMIIGDVNVGKSSIFNKIIDSERAIVTNIKGTTRDIISEVFVYDNRTFKIFDTAGYREKQGKVELIGYKKAIKISKNIDHFLLVFNGSITNKAIIRAKKDFSIGNNMSLICAKSDVIKPDVNQKEPSRINKAMPRTQVMKLIKIIQIHNKCIKKQKKSLTLNKSELDFLRIILNKELFLSAQEDILIIQEIIRNIIDEFSSNFGYINNEDILDNVFSSFCIGK